MYNNLKFRLHNFHKLGYILLDLFLLNMFSESI